ncbi:MAG: hypothetical protein J5824_04550 [Lachnospiraceae bacterium]|nr:hypothetical protein [Lachnospiraceae bacterium]
MKQVMRKIIGIMLITVMVLAMFGCKKKDKTKTLVEPTPTPVITMEDLYEIQKENAAKYSNLLQTAFKDQKIEISDASAVCDIGITGLSFDLMGYLAGDLSANGNFDFRSFGNIAHMIANLDAKASVGGETNEEKSSIELYLDNSGDGDMFRLYSKEDDKEWTVTERSIKEMLEQYSNDNVQNTEQNPEEKKYFKDLDDFLKNHTVMEEAGGVFRNTTSFTLQEFREYYSADFDAMMNEISDMISGLGGAEGSNIGGMSMDLSSIAGPVVAVIRECVSGMTGNIKTVQEFNSELKPTVMTLSVSSLSLSSKGDIKVSLNIGEFSIKLVNRDDISKVEIPEDVVNNAVSDNMSDDF